MIATGLTLAADLRDELRRADPLAPSAWWLAASFDAVLAELETDDAVFDELEQPVTNGSLYVLLGQLLATRETVE